MQDKNNTKTIHYLGIDYGKARIGLAVADSETKIAFAHSTVKNDRNFFMKLFEIIQAEKIKKVVIGIPTYVNREEVEYESEKFGKLLEKELDLEVEYQNEMFTTKMAQENLIKKGVKHVKSQDDQEAARIILQSWLDKS